MLVPEHIAPILQAAGVGTLGRDLFCWHLPSHVMAGVMVTGDLAGTDIDHELPGWRRGRIQVIVRDPDHTQGMAKAGRVMGALKLAERNLAATTGAPAVYIRRLRPVHDPIVYPRSEGDVIEFSMNFEGVWIAAP